MEGHRLTARSWKKRLPLGPEISGKGWRQLQAGGRATQASPDRPWEGALGFHCPVERPVPFFARTFCYRIDSERRATSRGGTQFGTAARLTLFPKARALGHQAAEGRCFGVRRLMGEVHILRAEPEHGLTSARLEIGLWIPW